LPSGKGSSNAAAFAAASRPGLAADLSAPTAPIVDSLSPQSATPGRSLSGRQSIAFQTAQAAANVVRIDSKTCADVLECERPIRIDALDPPVYFVEMAPVLGARRIQTALERDERFFEHSEH
jgi:hypothetical protein